jgi:hypothetical protein
VGHRGDRLVAGLQQVADEALQGQLLAGPDDPAQAVEQAGRHRPEPQRPRRGHSYGGGIAVQPGEGGQGRQPLGANLGRPRGALIGEDRRLGQQMDALRPQIEGQVLGHPLGAFRRPGHDQRRPRRFL